MKRTPWMQEIMTDAYQDTAIEAVMGGFDGSWERAIVKKLQKAVAAGNSQAEVILEAAEGNYLKAAYLITSSTTQNERSIY